MAEHRINRNDKKVIRYRGNTDWYRQRKWHACDIPKKRNERGFIASGLDIDRNKGDFHGPYIDWLLTQTKCDWRIDAPTTVHSSQDEDQCYRTLWYFENEMQSDSHPDKNKPHQILFKDDEDWMAFKMRFL